MLLEQDERWQLEGRRMFSLNSMAAIPASAEALPEPHQERAAMPQPTADTQAPARDLSRHHRAGRSLAPGGRR